MVMRLELAPICVAQSFLQHFAPFELYINIKTLLNTPPYEKHTFSEWKLYEESKYDIQKCVGGRVRMSGLRKSILFDQIWNFPSCVISSYPQPLLQIYHRIWIPYEIPLQKMYTWTGFELTILEKLRCLKKLVEFFVIFENIKLANSLLTTKPYLLHLFKCHNWNPHAISFQKMYTFDRMGCSVNILCRC